MHLPSGTGASSASHGPRVHTSFQLLPIAADRGYTPERSADDRVDGIYMAHEVVKSEAREGEREGDGVCVCE